MRYPDKTNCSRGNSELASAHSRFVQIGIASFGSIRTCAASPGGFSRLNYDVLQWLRRVKVNLSKVLAVQLYFYESSFRLTLGSTKLIENWMT